MKLWTIIALAIGLVIAALLLQGAITTNAPKPSWEVAKEIAAANQEIARGEIWTNFIAILLYYLVPLIVGGIVVFFLGNMIGNKLNERYELVAESRRAIDGSFGLIHDRIKIWNEKTGKMEWTAAVLDPSTLLTGRAYRDPATGAWIEPVPAEGYEEHRQIVLANRSLVAVAQATSPSTQAMRAQAEAIEHAGQRITIHNKAVLPPSGWGRQQLAAIERATPAPAQLTTSQDLEIKQVAWEEALAKATPTRWPIGYNPAPFPLDDEKRLCWFDLERDVSLGLPGIPGSGKSALEMNIIIQALRHGLHVVALDGKGGADLSDFEPYCDWQACTPATIEPQIDALVAEYQRRVVLLRTESADNISTYNRHGLRLRRILIAIEEFNAVWDKLDTPQRTRVDRKFGPLINESRFVGFNFVIVAQEPSKTPPYIKNAVFGSAAAIFRLGPSEAGFMAQNSAQTLDRRGQFIANGSKYYSWDVAAQVRAQLTTLPRLPDSARLLPALPTHALLDLQPEPATITLRQPGALEHPEVANGFQEIIDETATGTRLDPHRFDAILTAYFAADPARWGSPDNINGDDARPLARDFLIPYDREHYGLDRSVNSMASLAGKLLKEWRANHWQQVDTAR